MARTSPGDQHHQDDHQRVSVNRTRSLGVNPPKRRVDLFRLREKQRLTEEGFSDDELELLVQLGVERELTQDPMFLKEWLKLAPISRAVPRNGISRLLEAAAILRLPEVAWLRELMTSHTGSGRQPAEIGVSVIFSIALEGGPPNFSRRFEAFEGSNPLRSFVYDYPSMSKMKAANSAWHSAVRTHGADAVAHVNIALLRKLAALVEDPADKKQIKVGQYLVVDGTFQQADVAQHGSQNEGIEALIRGNYKGTAFMQNLQPDGTVTKETNGYNVVVLYDMATSLPVISFPYRADKDERIAATELLEMLFMIWPDCPAEYLVGDAYYDHSVSFASQLQFILNMNPIFGRHGGRSDSSTKFAATDGVPTCRHHPSGFKKRIGDHNFFMGLDGVRKGSPRGGEPPNRQARTKWKCRSEECHPVWEYTHPHEDPRRETRLPQQGDDWRFYHRKAALARRNIAESGFAVAREWHLWGEAPCRIAYAKTVPEATFAFGLGFLGFVGRRLVHANGMYDEVVQQARDLGLLDSATLDEPSPGPDHQELAAVREWLPQDPQPPQSWIDRPNLQP